MINKQYIEIIDEIVVPYGKAIILTATLYAAYFLFRWLIWA